MHRLISMKQSHIGSTDPGPAVHEVKTMNNTINITQGHEYDNVSNVDEVELSGEWISLFQKNQQIFFIYEKDLPV